MYRNRARAAHVLHQPSGPEVERPPVHGAPQQQPPLPGFGAQPGFSSQPPIPGFSSQPPASNVQTAVPGYSAPPPVQGFTAPPPVQGFSLPPSGPGFNSQPAVQEFGLNSLPPGSGSQPPAQATGFGSQPPAQGAGFGSQPPAQATGFGSQPPAQVAGFGSQPPAPVGGLGSQSSAPVVAFFNPEAGQNGHVEPPYNQDNFGQSGQVEEPTSAANPVEAEAWSGGQAAWSAASAEPGHAEHHFAQQALPQTEDTQKEYYPELILDPSGQWYWEHNQQQWLPYYQAQEAQPSELSQTAEEVPQREEPQSFQQPDQDVANSMANLGINSSEPTYNEEANRKRQDSEMSSVSQRQEVRQERQPSVEVVGYHPHYAEGVQAAQGYALEQRVQDVAGSGVVADHEAAHQDQSFSDHGSAMGPPDLVDHMPNTQPEIVSDLSRQDQPGPPQPSAQHGSVPPPDMFASLPAADGNFVTPDLTPNLDAQSNTRGSSVPEEFGAISHVAGPDLGAVGPSSLPGAGRPEPVANVQQLGAPEPIGAHAAPDLTAQSVIQDVGLHSTGDSAMSLSVSHDQHYDFYKGQIESAMPDLTSGRSGVLPPARAYPPQEGQVKAPDILRTEPLVPTSDRNLFMETGELREEDANRVSYRSHESLPSPVSSVSQVNNKPPSGLPPMVGGNDPPSLVRMVVGESVANSAIPPTSGERMVEGESTQPPSIPQPLPAREIEGEALTDPLAFANPRTIEGEDGSGTVVLPPPVRSREVEGQLMNPPPSRPFVGRTSPLNSPPEQEYVSSIPSTPLESSPNHLNSRAEVRSAAAGSERRDETVMGGPPATKAPPLPTPGRAVAGQESSTPYGNTKRRGDNHKKSTYDSDDDRNPDSDSERERERMRPQPRRTVSPGARSVRPRSTKGFDRMNRSSTEREEDMGRRPRDSYRDRRDDDRAYRKESARNDRGRYRESRRYYDDDDDIFDDRRSNYGGSRRIKEEPYRYRDDHYYRRNRNDSDYERESHYGEDVMNRSSRPASRAGSVSHYDPNESMYGRGMSGSNMAYFQQQLMHQQMAMMNPLQYQLQTAVLEMEKVLENPDNVNIYKQHWETYEKQPQLMEKLRLENPVMHHLLQHFRQNFWHLVEDKKPVIKEEVEEDRDSEMEQFAMKFHQLSASHRPESRQAGQESTIHGAEESLLPDSSSVLPERLTPLMFSRPHVCARISSNGVLVKVEASAPLEGQSATVDLHSMSSLLSNTREHQQLASFPGPLNPKETHKNDVIKFCERKIAEGRHQRMPDRESYELLWNMLILLLRQKGQVEGSDLADLLLREQRMDGAFEPNRSRGSSYRGGGGGQVDPEESSVSSLSEEQTSVSRSFVNPATSMDDCVSRFRSYLLHGNKQEGLEYAMKTGLWGHALFLASKMDQRTYAGVMTRFANGLAVNDPLQTLYQLMSARMPSAMKHCADQRWGDWRPHLAMILSNPLPGSDINRRSMVTLGDTLMGKGQLYAAQFCYIVSAVEFGTFTKKSSKLVLLCSSVGDKRVDEFATNEAIQCTEIYEFVQKLGNQEYEMPTLQPFKFLHAVRLCEAGLVSRAQDYCREVAEFVMRNPSRVESDFIPDFLQQIQHLSDRLKYQDPQYTTCSGELREIPDPEWMTRFAETVQNITYGGGVTGHAETTDYETMSYDYNQEQNGYYDSQYQYYQDPGYVEPPPSSELQPATGEVENSVAQGEQNYIGEEEPPVATYAEQQPEPEPQPQYEPDQVQTMPTMFNPADYSSGEPVSTEPAVLPAEPTVPGVADQPPLINPYSLPGGSRRSSVVDSKGAEQQQPPPTYFQPQPPPTEPAPVIPEKNNNVKPAEEVKSPEKKPAQTKPKKSSWFGGIFGKILRPPNQVHLPDDSDKSITYDEKLKRWVNKDGDDDSLAPAAPPPMDPSFAAGSMGQPNGGGPVTAGQAPSLGPASNGPAPPVSFRAPKRKGRGYVDVFGQSGVSTPITAQPPMLMNNESSSLPAIPAIFNPSLPPINDASSEETSLPPPASEPAQPESSMPMMFNPGSMAHMTSPPAF